MSVTNAGAAILAFIAENSISFALRLVPKINLTKMLACDKNTLDGLSMNRTTASYKMRFGLERTGN